MKKDCLMLRFCQLASRFGSHGNNNLWFFRRSACAVQPKRAAPHMPRSFLPRSLGHSILVAAVLAVAACGASSSKADEVTVYKIQNRWNQFIYDAGDRGRLSQGRRRCQAPLGFGGNAQGTAHQEPRHGRVSGGGQGRSRSETHPTRRPGLAGYDQPLDDGCCVRALAVDQELCHRQVPQLRGAARGCGLRWNQRSHEPDLVVVPVGVRPRRRPEAAQTLSSPRDRRDFAGVLLRRGRRHHRRPSWHRASSA